MVHRLTHELLHFLKAEGYTILIGLDKALMKEFVFTPVEWDVEKFKENSPFLEFSRYSIFLIDDLLGVDLKYLFTHRVVIPDGT
jgi:hypothetical protein